MQPLIIFLFLLIGALGIIILFLYTELKHKNDTFKDDRDFFNKETLRRERELSELKAMQNTLIAEAVAKAREDSLKRSRAVMRGQATEHLAPWLMDGMNPKDMRFIGQPIDYLVIDGLSDLVDGVKDEPLTVYLIDIKTGKSGLTKPQKRIRDAIQTGRLVFGVFNPDSREFTEYKYIEE